MSTTQAPERLTITTIDRDGFDFQEVRQGEGLGMASVGFTTTQFDSLDDRGLEKGSRAWETEVVDPAIEEVLPQVRDLIATAIEKRLPWTWEPK